jgi:hypothetical protein
MLAELVCEDTSSIRGIALEEIGDLTVLRVFWDTGEHKLPKDYPERQEYIAEQLAAFRKSYGKLQRYKQIGNTRLLCFSYPFISGFRPRRKVELQHLLDDPVIDSLACALAPLDEPPVFEVLRIIDSYQPGETTISLPILAPAYRWLPKALQEQIALSAKDVIKRFPIPCRIANLYGEAGVSGWPESLGKSCCDAMAQAGMFSEGYIDSEFPFPKEELMAAKQQAGEALHQYLARVFREGN